MSAPVIRHGLPPVDDLLHAGGAARGVSGNAVWGYLSGNGLRSAVAGGFLAAHTAADVLAAQSPSQETSA
ncbi:hypothetical protein [Pandoraea sp. SD6-2]|uniref:hypothetical protein n=1 Tax=Pandoraea TaxID=93217 RepID=UPI000330C5DF|nr:fumarate reductase/succinate dehydrogenase flavoprotein domain-containing protein [Pandoraea sp. SD6-2]